MRLKKRKKNKKESKKEQKRKWSDANVEEAKVAKHEWNV